MVPVSRRTLAVVRPEIDNVLDGYTADRGIKFGRKIRLGGGTTVRQCFDLLIAAVIEEMAKDEQLTVGARTAVIAMVAHTCAGQPRPLATIHVLAEQIPDLVRHFDHRTDPNAPRLAMSQLIFGAKRGEAEHTSVAFRAHMSAAPPRKCLWTSDDGRYTLQEATDPRHLVQDSRAMGHCLGYSYNEPALLAREFVPHTVESLSFLTYWMRIRRGETRILSLLDRDMPVCSMSYCPVSGSITHAEAAQEDASCKLSGSEPFMPALRRALFAVKDTLPLYGLMLPGLNPTSGALISPDNTVVPLHEALHADILTGSATVPRGVSDALLAKLCATSLVTLYLDQLPSARLAEMPETVRAHLCFRQAEVLLPTLRHARTIFGQGISVFRAPMLESAFNLIVTASDVETPRLQGAVEMIHAPRAKTFAAHITRARSIDLHDASVVSLPQLHYVATTLDISAVETVQLSKLARVGELRASKAQRLDLCKLEHATSIAATGALTVNAPKLRPRTQVVIGARTLLRAPRVETSRISRQADDADADP